MKWVCASLMPGMMVRLAASMTRVAGLLSEASSASLPTAMMRSPLIAIAPALGWRGLSVAMRALVMTVSAGSLGMSEAQPARTVNPARPALSLRNSRREAISHLHILRLELDARSLSLHQDQCRKILLGHAVADHLLNQIARQRSDRHWHFEPLAGVKAQVHVLAQQLRREGDVEVEIHQRRRLVAREHRAHHALVQKVEEGVPRYADLLRENGDLAQRLDHHAEEHVVADLGDARKFSFADIARARAHHVEEGPRLFVGLLRPGSDDSELARLDHLRVAAYRRGEVLDALLPQRFAQLGRALQRDRRALDDHLWLARPGKQLLHDLLDVVPRRDHAENNIF